MDRTTLLYVLSTVESNADFHEDDTVTIPLWAFDRLRDCLEKLKAGEAVDGAPA